MCTLFEATISQYQYINPSVTYKIMKNALLHNTEYLLGNINKIFAFKNIPINL